MPSVDTISSATSPSRGSTAVNAATSVFAAAAGPAGGIFAALLNGVGGDIADLLGLSATAEAAPVAASTADPSTRKTRLTDTADATTGDPAAALALAALLGTVPLPAIAPTLGSAASLGAAADGRSRATDPASGIGAPTADAAPAAASPAATTSAATGIGVASSAAALAATLVAETAAKSTAASTPATDTAAATVDTATPDPTTAGTATSPMPPALAAAIAAARPGADTPEALRRLTGRAVPATEPATTASTTAASPNAGSAAAAATAAAATVSAATAEADGSTTPTATVEASVTAEGEVQDAGSAAPRPVRALSEKDRDAAATTLGPQTGRTAAARDPEAPAPIADLEAAVEPSGRAAPTPADRERPTVDAAAGGPDTSADPTATALFADLGQTRAASAATGREASAASTAPVALDDLPRTIATRAQDGHSRFDIRLSPAELGGIDVRVEVRSSGEVRAHLVVERAETLDLMLRDQRQLERQLTDAGLDVGSSGLQFSLKDQPGGQPGQGWRTYGEAATRTERPPSDDTTTAETAVAAIGSAIRRPARLGGIDLSV